MGVAPEQLALERTAESRKRWQFPPTLFVHMARDKTTAAWIKEDMKALQQQVPACTAAPPCLPRCHQAPSCLCLEPRGAHAQFPRNVCALLTVLVLLQGVPAREIIVTEQQLSERFFSDRMPGFSPAASAAVFRALQAVGLIDAHGRLLKDPRCDLLKRLSGFRPCD